VADPEANDAELAAAVAEVAALLALIPAFTALVATVAARELDVLAFRKVISDRLTDAL